MNAIIKPGMPVAPAPPWGENDILQARVDAYFERMGGGHIIVGRTPGPDALELWSNDYLSLAGHPAIVKAEIEALEGGRADLYMSAVFLNENSLQRALERQWAAFVHAEAAVLCQSGWCANVGLIQSLADASTPVYLDQFATTSSWEGARAAGAPAIAFRHNRPESLEQLIKRKGPGLIVVDTVYAIDGSVCPLLEIAALGEKYGCIVIADESHTIGVYGPHGEGMVPALGLTEKVHYRTFSLSKAFVTRAGMVVGPQRTMSYFPFESRSAIFSSAVLPYELSALVATLKVIQEEDWRRQQLLFNARYLRDGLRRLGYAVDASHSHLIALHTGSDSQTVALRDVLEAQGVFGAVLCAPATPQGRGVIRLSVNAGVSESSLDRVVAAFKNIRHSGALDAFSSSLLTAKHAVSADRSRARGSHAVPNLNEAAAKMSKALDNWPTNGGAR